MVVDFLPTFIAGKTFLPQPQIIVEPALPFFARVKHRWEHSYGNKEFNRPESYKCINDKFRQLEPDAQRLWMDCNCMETFGKPFKKLNNTQKGKAIQWWKSLTKSKECFTNDHAWDDGYRDVIIPKNPNAPKFIMQENLVLGGATVKVLARTNGNYMVACLNINNPIPILLPRLGNEHLVHRATIITDEPIAGGYRVIPFPQFLENAVYLFIGDTDYNLLPVELLEPLPPGAPFPSPFYP